MPKPSLIYTTFLSCILAMGCSRDDEPKTTQSKEDWYSVSEINPQTWIFEESESSQVNVSYLIAGSEKAIMFDAGTGENLGQDGSKIMYKIEEITDLPVTLLLSHFHFDHNQNVHEFERIAFPDLKYLREYVSTDNVYSFSKKDLFLGSTPSELTVSEWYPLETDIDLGDRMIQVVNLSGHTDESVVIIDHTNKLVFSGDVLYNGALFIFDAKDIRPYLHSLEKLIAWIDDSYSIYGAHGSPRVSFKLLLDSKELLDCIENDDCFTESSTLVFGKDATVYQSLSNTAVVILIH